MSHDQSIKQDASKKQEERPAYHWDSKLAQAAEKVKEIIEREEAVENSNNGITQK